MTPVGELTLEADFSDLCSFQSSGHAGAVKSMGYSVSDMDLGMGLPTVPCLTASESTVCTKTKIER